MGFDSNQITERDVAKDYYGIEEVASLFYCFDSNHNEYELIFILSIYSNLQMRALVSIIF